MRALSASGLLDAWEKGSTQSPVERALTLLTAARPDWSSEDLAELPIGERDRNLLRLREVLFGPQLIMVSQCPKCGESLESACRVPDLHSQEAPAVQKISWATQVDGYSATFRLPTSSDLLALPRAEDPALLRHFLLARCVLDARDPGDEKVSAELLPPHVVDAIAIAMAVEDPQADVRIELTCPTCAHRWEALFDIAGFLWKEIHSWAHRTLRDVHCLARAYGWREADVLALTPTRRQIYLELSRP